MDKNKTAAVLFILIILIFCNISFIWINSLATSEVSNSVSKKIAGRIQPVLDPDDQIPEELFMDYIRKSAHLAEFFILGAMCTVMRLIMKKTHIFTILFILLSVAVADEFIQSLSDRTASVRDIILDFIGASAGMATVFLISFIAVMLRGSTRRKPDILSNIFPAQ